MITELFERIVNSLDEKILVLVMLVLVAVMLVCGIVAIVTLDKDNDEMRMILEGLLKEKRAAEEEKNREKTGAKNEFRGRF